MGNRLWENRTAAAAKDGLHAAWCLHEGVFHFIQCNDAGELTLHLIEERTDKPSVTDLPELQDAAEMVISADFELLPKMFRDSGIPGFEGTTSLFSLDDDMHLCAGIREGQNAFHAIAPLYSHAKTMAAQQALLVYCYMIQTQCFVLVFRNGQCEMANCYPAANESEILYFCMAAAKKSEMDLKQTAFRILGNKTSDLLQSFERFHTIASPARIDLPYPAGEYPPHAAESYLLYHHLTCVLPEAN